jgi:hypothetical protein
MDWFYEPLEWGLAPLIFYGNYSRINNLKMNFYWMVFWASDQSNESQN